MRLNMKLGYHIVEALATNRYAKTSPLNFSGP
jgi:hypothetical protein